MSADTPQDPPTGESLVAKVSVTAGELPDPGKNGAAVVAPATGPIDQPPETPVITVVHGFFKSPPIKWMLGILAGVLATVLVKLQPLLTAPVLDWSLIWLTFKAEIVAALVTAFCIWLKINFNNPANGPTFKKEPS